MEKIDLHIKLKNEVRNYIVNLISRFISKFKSGSYFIDISSEINKIV